jgi:hypothetical protein
MDMIPGGEEVTVFARDTALESMAICSLREARASWLKRESVTRKRRRRNPSIKHDLFIMGV